MLYPVFDRCKRYTFDEYWRHLLTECAFGRFPSTDSARLSLDTCPLHSSETTALHENHEKSDTTPTPALTLTLSVTSSKDQEVHTTSHVLPTVDCEVMRTMISVFQKMGLQSPTDLRLARSARSDVVEWKKTRQKQVKTKLLMDYLLAMQRKWKLNKKDTKNLFNKIQLALQFKTITSENIVCENSRITEIKGLGFEEGQYHFPEMEGYEIVSPTLEEDAPKGDDRLSVLVEKWAKGYIKQQTKQSSGQ